MPTVSRFSGLSISTPDAYRVEDLPATPAVSTTRRPRGTRRSGPVPLPAAKPPDSEVLLEALQTQDLTVVDRVLLEPVAPAAAMSRAAPIGPQQTSIDLNVAPDEDAVLLLEQEGVYSWVLPSSSDVRPVVTRMRGMLTSTRQVRFTIEVGSTRQPAARRGLVTDFIVDRVRVYALKFVARIALGATVRFLERNVRRGLIVIPSKDPATWVLRAPADVKLPTGRPARVLLFVHGTFSSTVGSFGALAGTPWGQQFLDAAFTEYDAIIGYDHSTLADDPITNATDLLAALEAMAPQVPPRLDVVSFSRGGLVFRSLVEHLLPHSTFKCHIERAVFVGCTNAGTQLANPDNWQAFVDLYTNLAVASFRLLSLMPQAAAPTLVLKELIQGLGAVVKCLAASGTHDVPGLAAMRPDGDFVQTLNQLQQGQPQPGDIKYYAITSEFAPNAAASPGQTTELPHRLVLALADGLVDRVMGEANDLVVNTRSMTAIDESIGTFLVDTFAFGPTPHVYHTIYFMRPEVVNSLARWLELSAPDQARRSLPPLPSVRDVPVPATVDTDFLLLDWGLPVGQAISTIDSRVPSYVIFNQPTDSEGGYYAMTPHEVMQVTGKMDPAMPIGKAIDFGSWPPSRERSLETAINLRGAPSLNERVVVVHNAVPIGVVPEERAFQDDLVALAKTAVALDTLDDRVSARRSMPTFSVELPAAGGPPGPPLAPTSVLPNDTRRTRSAPGTRPTAPTTTQTFFRADMDSEVRFNSTALVNVDVSREPFAQLLGRMTAAGSGPVDLESKLTVQIIPRTNFTLVDPTQDREEFNVPEAGEVKSLYFEVKAAHEGPGEIWIIARQRQMGIARLVLTPKVLPEEATATKHRTTVAGAADPAPHLRSQMDQLLIIEQVIGETVQYSFELELPSVNYFEMLHSEPLKVKRDEYVANLYKEIEERYISSSNSAVDKADTQAFTHEMQAYGATLFEELFPRKMQEVLWTYRNQLKSIRIVSTEPFIPWEIVHLREPDKPVDLEAPSLFLGQMGLTRWLHNVDGLPPSSLTVRPERARYVIPDYLHPDWKLPSTAQERSYLQKTFSAQPVDPQPDPVLQILAKPGSADLLHFACHGQADSQNISHARIVLQGRVEGQNFVPTYLDAATVNTFARLRSPDRVQPIIFLNACQTGRAGYKLTGIGGFAQSFLKAGAGAFVGTLWSVGDEPAFVFGQAFYDELRKGATVAESTIAAREAARKAGDATWLAYVVYAHPHATLT